MSGRLWWSEFWCQLVFFFSESHVLRFRGQWEGIAMNMVEPMTYWLLKFMVGNGSLTNQQGFWEDVGRIQVDNPYSISALAWKPDGRFCNFSLRSPYFFGFTLRLSNSLSFYSCFTISEHGRLVLFQTEF